jgi:hypothetical protein
MLTKPADKQAMELFATGWDRIAENREAMLSSKEQAEPLINRRLHVRYFLRSLALARAAFAAAVAEKPAGWFMIRNRIRVGSGTRKATGEAAISVLAVVRPRRCSVSDGCPTAGDGSGFNQTSDNSVEEAS